VQESDINDIPFYCLLAYLFNPYSILNCVGQTTTIFSNFLLAVTIFAMTKNWKLLCFLTLALEGQKSFYSLILIFPIALAFREADKSRLLVTTVTFGAIFAGLNYVAFVLMGSWQFLDSTYGFIIHCRDLTPNIGLFW
jgi:GPI-anchor transamidase subunit U